MFSCANTSDITAGADWSNRYQPPIPGVGDVTNGVQSHDTRPDPQQAENPEWKKAREALAKISPQNAVKPTSNVQQPPPQQAAAVPSYGGYPYYPSFCNMYNYRTPYNYQNYPTFQQGQSINPPQMAPVQRQTPTQHQAPAPLQTPTMSNGFIPSLQTSGSVSQTRPREELQATFDKQEEIHSFKANDYEKVVQLSEPFKMTPSRTSNSFHSKNSFLETPQYSKPKEVLSYAAVVKNEKQQFWKNPKKEESPAWIKHERTPSPPKKSKNESNKQHLEAEDNNNSAALSSQDWPPSLKDYVQRAFEQCETEEHKDFTERHLKKILTKAFKQGSAWGIDWDKELLPCVKQERESRPSHTELPSKLKQRLGRRQTIDERKPSRSRSRSHSSARSRSPNSVSSMNSSPESSRRISRNTRNRERGRNNERGGRRPKQGGKHGQNKKKDNKENVFAPVDPESSERRQKRAARFQDTSADNGPGLFGSLLDNLNSSLLHGNEDEESIDWTKFHIVGTCEELEKSYFRLTAPPDPSTVRPIELLKQSLEMVKKDWKTKQDYHYACEQLKSIRQDLTVQGIRNDFTVQIYETHARLALEKSDRAEFNQCQSQLKCLYSENLDGHKNEFIAYKILYLIYTQNTHEFASILSSLTTEEKNDTVVKHALKMRSAWSLSNYHSFFQLYSTAPNMGGYLLDLFVERERERAIKMLVKSSGLHPPDGHRTRSLVDTPVVPGVNIRHHGYNSSFGHLHTRSCTFVNMKQSRDV